MLVTSMKPSHPTKKQFFSTLIWSVVLHMFLEARIWRSPNGIFEVLTDDGPCASHVNLIVLPMTRSNDYTKLHLPGKCCLHTGKKTGILVAVLASGCKGEKDN